MNSFYAAGYRDALTKLAATRWEQVFRESPEILEEALAHPDRYTNMSRSQTLNNMDMFMDAKKFLKKRLGTDNLPSQRLSELRDARRAAPYGINSIDTSRRAIRYTPDRPPVEQVLNAARNANAYRKVEPEYLTDILRNPNPRDLTSRQEVFKELFNERMGPTPDLAGI